MELAGDYYGDIEAQETNKNMNYGDALDYLLFQHDEYDEADFG